MEGNLYVKLLVIRMENIYNSKFKYIMILSLTILAAVSCISFVMSHYKITFNIKARRDISYSRRDTIYLKHSNREVDRLIAKHIKEWKNTNSDNKRFKYHVMSKDLISVDHIERNLIYLTSTSHLAGTKEDIRQAKWIANKFKKYGLDNIITKTYNVLLSYPVGPGNLTLYDRYGKTVEKICVVEKKLDDFEKTTNYSLYPPFISYSPSGNVKGEMIYANFGKPKDFLQLKDMGIDVKNKILLLREGKSKSKMLDIAEAEDALGVILFTDPDAFSANGSYYPNSWFLPPDGVQRGTPLGQIGDTLSRGYPAIKGLYSRPVKEVNYKPKVPVQPIGFGDALKLLDTLDGEPPPSQKWKGSMNSTYNVTSKYHRKVKIQVNVTKEMRDIKDVIGVFTGETEPDRVVIIGNHRDSWTYGAVDPSSGTAIIIEVARILGVMKDQGWKPRRTIMLCSWDAEEYSIIGSTEWAKEYAKILSQQAIVYLNLDTAVQGNYTINLKSTPELIDAVFHSTKLVKDPDSMQNIYDTWLEKQKETKTDNLTEPSVQMFGVDSDYNPFYTKLGIPALDMKYMFKTENMGKHYPVYHTMHDNIAWLKKFVAPDFRYHATIAKIWTQLILLLADATLLPFNFIRYCDILYNKVERLSAIVKDNDLDDVFNLGLLRETVDKLSNASREFHYRLTQIDLTDSLAVRIANDQMMLFERTFVTSEDAPEKSSIRHVYHHDDLFNSLQDVIDNRNSKSYLDTLQTKYSIFTYHLMMATHALKNPFMASD